MFVEKEEEMKVLEMDENNLSNELIKRIFFSAEKEEYSSADYLIIYGRHIKESLDERLNHASEILKSKKIGRIVLTGGVGVKGDFNESKYMYDFLINKGIDTDRIIVENKSTISEENNVNVMNLLNLQNTTESISIVLVSHEVHMWRLRMHWKKLLKNKNNIHFYYDYVTKTKMTYDNMINELSSDSFFKEQISKTKKFIIDGVYEDIEI